MAGGKKWYEGRGGKRRNLAVWGFVISLAFYGGSGLFAQTQFSGTIKDQLTGQPIAEATVTFEGGRGSITDAQGRFSIGISRFPVILSISHVAYHPQQQVIQSPVQSGMIISLQPLTVEIREVVVTAERQLRIFKDRFFYVIDYDFSGDNLLVAGYENHQMGRGRLALINDEGDTLSYIPVNNPKKMFHDAYGFSHLYAGDSVYQLFIQNDSIQLLYPMHKWYYPDRILDLKIVDGSRFIFKEVQGQGQAHLYYVIDTLLDYQLDLYTVYNRDQFSSADDAGGFRRKDFMIDSLGLSEEDFVAMARDVFETSVYDELVQHKPVESEIFQTKAGMRIIDYPNARMICFRGKNNDIYTVPLTMIDHTRLQKKIIQDDVTLKLYSVQRGGGKVTLFEIDPNDGQVVSIRETAELPMLENLRIHNGTIWFLYEAKIGETVRSLYRVR